MKPSWPVLNPITQMIRLLTAAITQPVQHLFPTRIVEKTVRTQDKQSSRHTSESTSSFMFYLHSEVEARLRSEEMTPNLSNLRIPVMQSVSVHLGKNGNQNRYLCSCFRSSQAGGRPYGDFAIVTSYCFKAWGLWRFLRRL